MQKSPDAFRTISEVSEWLDTPAHVLRFWESRFTQVKPVKRAGGRRYYRPSDMQLLSGIKRLLYDDGITIRGVQKILREKGVKHVSALSAPLNFDDATDAHDDLVDEIIMIAPSPAPDETPAPDDLADGAPIEGDTADLNAVAELTTPQTAAPPAEPAPAPPADTLANVADEVAEQAVDEPDLFSRTSAASDTPAADMPDTDAPAATAQGDRPAISPQDTEIETEIDTPTAPPPLGADLAAADPASDDEAAVPPPTALPLRARFVDHSLLRYLQRNHRDDVARAVDRLQALRDRMSA